MHAPHGGLTYPLQDLKTLNDLAEHHVLPITLRCRGQREEEL